MLTTTGNTLHDVDIFLVLARGSSVSKTVHFFDYSAPIPYIRAHLIPHSLYSACTLNDCVEDRSSLSGLWVWLGLNVVYSHSTLTDIAPISIITRTNQLVLVLFADRILSVSFHIILAFLNLCASMNHLFCRPHFSSQCTTQCHAIKFSFHGLTTAVKP